MQVLHSCCAGLDAQEDGEPLHQLCETEGAKRQKCGFSEPLPIICWHYLTLKKAPSDSCGNGGNGSVLDCMGVLEGQFEQMLVNPQHIKTVPGRKTDTKNCEWIADPLQHGLLKESFVPPTAARCRSGF